MWIDGCEFEIQSLTAPATIEFEETFEPNVIVLIFRDSHGGKVLVRIDVTNAVNRSVLPAKHMAALWKRCARKLWRETNAYVDRIIAVNARLERERNTWKASAERAESALAAMKEDARLLAEIIAPLSYVAGPLRDIALRILESAKGEP